LGAATGPHGLLPPERGAPPAWIGNDSRVLASYSSKKEKLTAENASAP
jgi:hypothetical protein